MPGTGVPLEYRYALLQLANSGNTDAVEFFVETPDFAESGRRGMTCYRILKANGNERAGKIYDDRLWKDRERCQRKRAQHDAEMEFVNGNQSPARDEDDEMETQESEETRENHETDGDVETTCESPSDDDMEDVADVGSPQDDLVTMEKEGLCTDSTTQKDPESSQSTNSSNSDDPEDTNVETDHRQQEINQYNSVSPDPAVELVEVIVLSDNESDTSSELITNEYTLRKSRAEAGSMRESKILEKLSLESEIRALSSDSESELTHAKKRNHLRLKLALVEADVAFYEKGIELASLNLARGRQQAQVSNKVVEARLRKAWWDAEVAFSDLVLAFPLEKGMERPAFPRG